jgi:hypothetical protein
VKSEEPLSEQFRVAGEVDNFRVADNIRYPPKTFPMTLLAQISTATGD